MMSTDLEVAMAFLKLLYLHLPGKAKEIRRNTPAWSEGGG
jgi:hypothetical protein